MKITSAITRHRSSRRASAPNDGAAHPARDDRRPDSCQAPHHVGTVCRGINSQGCGIIHLEHQWLVVRRAKKLSPRRSADIAAKLPIAAARDGQAIAIGREDHVRAGRQRHIISKAVQAFDHLAGRDLCCRNRVVDDCRRCHRATGQFG